MAESKSACAIARKTVEELSARHKDPHWLRDYRLSAWEAYLAAPMPSPKDEDWRFTDVSEIDLSHFMALRFGRPDSPEVPDAVKKLEKSIGKHSGIIHLSTSSNGYVRLADELKKKGVIFLDLETAIAQHPEKIKQYLTGRQASDSRSKFELMARAFFNHGVFLYVPKGLEIELPFIVSFAVDGSTDSPPELENGGAIFPRLIAGVEANSKVNIVYAMTGSSAKDSSITLSAGITEVFVGSGSLVNYLEVASPGSSVYCINQVYNEVEKDGKFASLTAALGGGKTKTDISVNLKEPGAISDTRGIVLGADKEHFDFNTIQEHAAPDTTSDINFRVALKDSSTSVYQGIIKVDKQAQRTAAYQSNKNLLLGGEAKADTIPRLEILADDVKCSHGATVGPIDRDQIFYLMSRGLHEPEAEKLVVSGFFQEVLESFNRPEETAWLSKLIEKKVMREQND